MGKTLIGIATYGLVNFTRLAVQGIRETVKSPYELYFVVGKSDDQATIDYLNQEKLPFSYHEYNKGFPAAVNDIYDYGWLYEDFDYIIIMGNDVIPYPYAIDSMIKVADTADYEWVCANQYDVKSLCAGYPQAKQYFEGATYNFNFQGEPWKLPTNFTDEIIIAPGGFSDVQNLCLYKRSVFDTIGYTDPNFYPAYYIDNDYARRGVNANIKSCTLPNSVYFHFWSRVIHQGSGGSTHKYFEMNRKFYEIKWGGDFGREKYKLPFDGDRFLLGNRILLHPTLKIPDRDNEKDIIDFWIHMKR